MAHSSGPCAFLKLAWTSGACNFIPVLLLYISGYGVMAPYLPNLLTDFFSSRIQGSPIRCEDFEPTTMPDACLQGSSVNVFWSSLTSFFTNSILVFFCAPMTGVWSDMLGRKPFLILAQFLSIASKVIVLFHVFSGTTLYAYYPVELINGVVSPIVVTLAAVADVIPPEHRAAMFSVTLGSFSVGIAAPPKLGIALGLKKAIALGVALKALGIIYTVVAVRETVTVRGRQLAKQASDAHAEETRRASCALDAALRAPDAPPPSWSDAITRVRHGCMEVPAIRHTAKGLAVVSRNSEFVKLAAALMVASFVQAGLYDIESQYLLTLFGFDQIDFAQVFMLVGIGMLVVQVLVMPALLAVTSEHAMVAAAFLSCVVKLAGLAGAAHKWQCYAAICVGSLYYMAFPAIAGIKANAVAQHEQGSVQGAIAGVQALASGLGPLLFMAVYTRSIDTDSPRVVMYVGVAIALVPLILIAFLDLGRLQQWKEHGSPGQCPGSPRRGLEEPLLPKDTPEAGAPEAGAHGLTAHDILVEDGAMGHWEADGAAGFSVQQGPLHHSVLSEHTRAEEDL